MNNCPICNGTLIRQIHNVQVQIARDTCNQKLPYDHMIVFINNVLYKISICFNNIEFCWYPTVKDLTIWSNPDSYSLIPYFQPDLSDPNLINKLSTLVNFI